jgi:hypothetical protein
VDHKTNGGPPDLAEALRALESILAGPGPTSWIGSAERQLRDADGNRVKAWLLETLTDGDPLGAALAIKRVAGQINVVVHALGILTALPYILDPGETVDSLSLGAGNTGREHDLTTNLRIAEFKFIDWRGGSETIRQNGLFADLFNLVVDPTPKHKSLYVVGLDHPLEFLNGRRSLVSVMSRNSHLAKRFQAIRVEGLVTVADYFASVQGQVEIVDLAGIVPGLRVTAVD